MLTQQLQSRQEKRRGSGALLCASDQIKKKKKKNFPEAPSRQVSPYTSQARLGHGTTHKSSPTKSRVVAINVEQSRSISWNTVAWTALGSVVKREESAMSISCVLGIE